MATSRRGKRGQGPSSSRLVDRVTDTNESDAPEQDKPTTSSATSPQIDALAPPKFSFILCMSLAFTHIIDLSKTLSAGRDSFQYGVISPEAISAVPVNATAYCLRHFKNTTEIKADLDNLEEVIAELGCTSTDFSILNIKYQTSMLRVGLCIVTSILCWGDLPLLKTWNYAYCTFLVLTLGCLYLESSFLKGNEKFSLLATLILLITSNRNGRQKRVHLDIKEGMFNLALFFLVVFMSYVISFHLINEVENFTYLDTDNVTSGGRSTWFMIVAVEYSILIIVGLFALFYFDEDRKRVSTCIMKIECYFISKY